jgi:hypothetical protein
MVGQRRGEPARRPDRRRGGRAARLIVAALAAVLGACAGEPTGLEDLGTGGYARGGAAARALDPALVGTWSRVLLLGGDRGVAHAIETQWTFRADGRAERRVVTTNLALGLGDQILTVGQWSTERDGTLTVAFAGAAGGTFRARYRVLARLDGAQLALDDQLFERLAGVP